MNTPSRLWKQLRKGRRYRGEFVATFVKKLIPLEIRRLLKQRGMSQEALADRADLTQGVVSRAANLDYGNLTLNTIVKIASGFDVAFIGMFVAFTEFEQWASRFSESSLSIKTFEDEDKEIKAVRDSKETVEAKAETSAAGLQCASNAELVAAQEQGLHSSRAVNPSDGERASAEAVARKQPMLQMEKRVALVGTAA